MLLAEKTKTMNSDPPESLFSSSFFLSFFLRISFYVYERTLERTAFFWTFKTLLLYKKRETDDGNSVFDYTDQTDDPNDDCSMPSQHPATTHSFEKRNASSIQPQYDSMKNNHINFLKKIGRDKGAFNNMLKNRSRADFIERYSGL